MTEVTLLLFLLAGSLLDSGAVERLGRPIQLPSSEAPANMFQGSVGNFSNLNCENPESTLDTV